MSTIPPFFCCLFIRDFSRYDAKFKDFLYWAITVDRHFQLSPVSPNGGAWIRRPATVEPDLDYAIAFRYVENGEPELRYFALAKTGIGRFRPWRHVEITEEEVERAGLARTGRCVTLRCERHSRSYCLEINAVDDNVEETSEE